MMVLDHVGDQEAIVYAQLGQQPLVRTTETSLEPRPGTLSCLSARPPDLDFWTGTRPRVVGVSPSIVPFLYSKRTAAARSPRSRMDDWTFCPVIEHIGGKKCHIARARKLLLFSPFPRVRAGPGVPAARFSLPFCLFGR
jgi:hypothetical protein